MSKAKKATPRCGCGDPIHFSLTVVVEPCPGCGNGLPEVHTEAYCAACALHIAENLWEGPILSYRLDPIVWSETNEGLVVLPPWGPVADKVKLSLN